MSLAYQKAAAADRRLQILELLDAGARQANLYTLHSALVASGHPSSMAAVEGDLLHLQDVGAIRVEVLPGGIKVAHLLQYGLDVAKGRAQAPDVARPQLG